MAPKSSLYRIYIDTYEAAFHELRIGNVTQLVNEFPPEREAGASAKINKPTETSTDIWLEAGNPISIELKYAQKLGPTKIRLLWESDSIAK